MSKYEEMSTVLAHEGYLVEALEQIGYKPEVHKNGAALYGYRGDERPNRLSIIIRRGQLDSASERHRFCARHQRPIPGRRRQLRPRDQVPTKRRWGGYLKPTKSARRWRLRKREAMYFKAEA